MRAGSCATTLPPSRAARTVRVTRRVAKLASASNRPRADFEASRLSYWTCSFALYAVLAWLYTPALSYGLHTLDDQSQLAHVANKSAGDLLGLDHFGHFRPIKNLFFAWLASVGSDALVHARAVVLGIFLATVGLVQALAQQVLRSRWLGF